MPDVPRDQREQHHVCVQAPRLQPVHHHPVDSQFHLLVSRSGHYIPKTIHTSTPWPTSSHPPLHRFPIPVYTEVLPRYHRLIPPREPSNTHVWFVCCLRALQREERATPPPPSVSQSAPSSIRPRLPLLRRGSSRDHPPTLPQKALPRRATTPAPLVCLICNHDMCTKVVHKYGCGHVFEAKAPCATSRTAPCGVCNVKTVKHDEKCETCDR